MLVHLLNQNHSPDTIHEHQITDSKKFKNEVINVFTQTDYYNSSGNEISKNHNF